jgi:hypothetical protein
LCGLVVFIVTFSRIRRVRARDRMIVGLQLPVQSVPITIKVMSSNPDHVEVFSMHYYVIKFVNDLRQVSGFLWVFRIFHQ